MTPMASKKMQKKLAKFDSDAEDAAPEAFPMGDASEGEEEFFSFREDDDAMSDIEQGDDVAGDESDATEATLVDDGDSDASFIENDDFAAGSDDDSEAGSDVDADEEQDDGMQTNIAADGFQLPGEGEEDDQGGLVATDIGAIQQRIQDIVRVLNSFKELAEQGRCAKISIWHI